MKKKIFKNVSLFMVCLTLSLSVFSSYSITANASAVSIALPRIIDIVLTKQGIVADTSSLASVGDILIDTLDTAFTGYITYCTENGLDWNDEESYRLWKENTNIVNALLDAIVKNKQENNDDGSITDTNVIDVIVPDTDDGNDITIPKDVAEPIVDSFNTWWEDCGGYYLVYVPSYKELSAFYCNTTVFENVEYITSKHDFLYIHFWTSLKPSYYKIYDLDSSHDGFVYNSLFSTDGLPFHFYNEWVCSSTSRFEYSYYDDEGNSLGSSSSGLDSYYYNEFTTYSETSSFLLPEIKLTSGYYGLVANEAQYVKIWKTLDGLKSYSIGMQNVYYSPTYSVTEVNDCVITYDYITNYGDTYSYSTVQEQIDNSTEITEETVNSIVGSTVTNITNNYYYTDTGTGTDGTTSGGDSEDLDSDNLPGLFDGLLSNLLTLVTELLEFIVKFLVKGIELIAQAVASVVSILGDLTTTVAGMGGLLSAFFPFIPQEFFDIMLATITCLCGISIYRALKG